MDMAHPRLEQIFQNREQGIGFQGEVVGVTGDPHG
jgi:hypothetical protein